MDELELVPRSAGKEGLLHGRTFGISHSFPRLRLIIEFTGNGCFSQSYSGQQRDSRSDAFLHWLQATTFLHVHSYRTGVCSPAKPERVVANMFCFHRDMKDQGDRDVFNERPTRDEATAAITAPAKLNGPSPIAHAATIHTSEGDIHMRLFPEHAPKAVENFVGHARSGYYEGIIFHRVIPKFMIQTGDPLGDGTGGDSIWGKEFEDEFTTALRHDRYVITFVS